MSQGRRRPRAQRCVNQISSRKIMASNEFRKQKNDIPTPTRDESLFYTPQMTTESCKCHILSSRSCARTSETSISDLNASRNPFLKSMLHPNSCKGFGVSLVGSEGVGCVSQIGYAYTYIYIYIHISRTPVGRQCNGTRLRSLMYLRSTPTKLHQITLLHK